MGEETQRGQSRPDLADLSSESGWITTEVAAKAVRVSPRTIRRYIERGELEAKPQGEGVRRELETLQETRESPVSPGPTEDPPQAPAAPQTAAQRPWWRRWFGG